MKNLINKLAPLALLMFLVACANPYEDGLKAGKAMGRDQGYQEGYAEGKTDGDGEGYARAKAYFESAGFNEGFTDGKKVGDSAGYSQGYTVGKNETYKPNYDRGYDVGYDDGYEDGDDRGYVEGRADGRQDAIDYAYDQGYKVGYDRGYDDGEEDGYDLGYDDGMADGYDIGYDDGFADGSLSVGKSKNLRGYANIISLAHNSIIDYSKIAAPKATSKGLLVNGRMLFSETSLTNKDTLKRQAAVEQYLVVEMAKQVKGKFGLSDERSLKMAKAANHFRKQSSKRALTSEDTDAYASEIIGSNFSEIQDAYRKSLIGDPAAFSSVLDRAAEKNGTSATNISVIIAKYFM